MALPQRTISLLAMFTRLLEEINTCGACEVDDAWEYVITNVASDWDDHSNKMVQWYELILLDASGVPLPLPDAFKHLDDEKQRIEAAQWLRSYCFKEFLGEELEEEEEGDEEEEQEDENENEEG